jgi:murein DD-endopeptidase MepM/ murein hydrolase activator NlpD
MKIFLRVILSLGFIILIVFTYFYFNRPDWLDSSGRSGRVREWIKNPQANPIWLVPLGQRCPDAPFKFPTDGYPGYLWGDSFKIGSRHQGIDIFAATPIGQTRVVAAYDGYLTRLPDWKSAVIIRIPSDPLQPGRQIWTYYAHMADEKGNSFISSEFPQGTNEVFVKAGTFLGYQGDYSGDPENPVGVHLHFSIVLDDGSGHFLNELKIENTLDPSPYFSMNLNGKENEGEIPTCQIAGTP